MAKQEYFGTMPWLALPFASRAEAAAVSGRFGIRGIPALVIIDENGEVINTNARGAVSNDHPGGSQFPWKGQADVDGCAVSAACFLLSLRSQRLKLAAHLHGWRFSDCAVSQPVPIGLCLNLAGCLYPDASNLSRRVLQLVYFIAHRPEARNFSPLYITASV